MYVAPLCVPWEQQVTRVLWWTLLGDVEAAHVWMHRCHTGVGGGRGGQEGLSHCPRPNHRIRQRSSSAVHQFHCLQASCLLRCLISELLDPFLWGSIGLNCTFILGFQRPFCFLLFHFRDNSLCFGFVFFEFPMEWMRTIMNKFG